MAYRAVIQRADQEESGVAVTVVFANDVDKREKTFHVNGDASAVDAVIVQELNNLNTPILTASSIKVGPYTPPPPPIPVPGDPARDQFASDLIVYLRMKKATDLGIDIGAGVLATQLKTVQNQYNALYLDLFGTGQEPV